MSLSLRQLLVAALASGLVAGLVFFAVQSFTTRPLIAQAETFEHSEAVHEHGEHDHAWKPADGTERHAYTVAADVLIGIGYGFLLVGAVGASGRTITVGSGLAWGAAGFVTFFAAPSLGLPPEPPGAHAADLLLRQEWWLGTALATGTGLALLLLQRRTALRLVGAALLVAPHLIGAPQLAGVVDGHSEISAAFVWASLAANAALWLVLGAAVGLLVPQFADRDALAHPGEVPG